jgi:hypothetical protein
MIMHNRSSSRRRFVTVTAEDYVVGSRVGEEFKKRLPQMLVNDPRRETQW